MLRKFASHHEISIQATKIRVAVPKLFSDASDLITKNRVAKKNFASRREYSLRTTKILLRQRKFVVRSAKNFFRYGS